MGVIEIFEVLGTKLALVTCMHSATPFNECSNIPITLLNFPDTGAYQDAKIGKARI